MSVFHGQHAVDVELSQLIHKKTQLVVAAALLGTHFPQLITFGVPDNEVLVGTELIMQLINSLRRAKRQEIKIFLDAPLAFLEGHSNRREVSAKQEIWSWCVANHVEVESCTSVCAPLIVKADPWQIKPTPAISYWHSIAVHLRDARKRNVNGTHLLIADPWTASKRGVLYSLPYVNAENTHGLATFLGRAVPRSSIYNSLNNFDMHVDF